MTSWGTAAPSTVTRDDFDRINGFRRSAEIRGPAPRCRIRFPRYRARKQDHRRGGNNYLAHSLSSPLLVSPEDILHHLATEATGVRSGVGFENAGQRSATVPRRATKLVEAVRT